jgi:Ran-binding protein 9/10
VLTHHRSTTIAVGFSTKAPQLSRPVGWEPESWGYHGDDGRTFNAANVGHNYSTSYNQGDIIGCGVNFRERKAFFTRNGVFVGKIIFKQPCGSV